MERANYFKLFDLPIAFDLDLSQLLRKMLELQKAHHPDKSSASNATEQSAVINAAYKTLENPLTRAQHIFILKQLSPENKSVPQHLLMDALEWREQLAAANDAIKLNALYQQINQLEQQEWQKIATAFANEQYETALDIYVTLLFVKRFLNEITAKM